MFKNFQDTAVLTSQNPESFLTFTYDASPNIPLYIVPSIDVPLSKGVLLVNGLDMSDPSNYMPNTLTLSSDASVASFLVFTPSLYDFGLNLHFDIYDDALLSTLETTIDVSILNRKFVIDSNHINIYDPFQPLLDNETSYLLLRTNPKFSGNIKVVVDSSNNLYLDTFKVSDILSNKKYRKQNISANSMLSSAIRNTFDSLPKGEIYQIDSQNTLNSSVPKTNLYDQYNDTYSYGSRL